MTTPHKPSAEELLQADSDTARAELERRNPLAVWPEHNSPREVMDACGLADTGMNLPHKCLECGRQQVWVWMPGDNGTSVCPACQLKELRSLRSAMVENDCRCPKCGSTNKP